MCEQVWGSAYSRAAILQGRPQPSAARMHTHNVLVPGGAGEGGAEQRIVHDCGALGGALVIWQREGLERLQEGSSKGSGGQAHESSSREAATGRQDG